jgi:hypothetical protein
MPELSPSTPRASCTAGAGVEHDDLNVNDIGRMLASPLSRSGLLLKTDFITNKLFFDRYIRKIFGQRVDLRPR